MTQLDILVCGSGMAGLTAAIGLARKGHKVTVLEAAPKLSEVGAGIQIPPNSTRILYAYGLADKFKPCVVAPEIMTVKRYENGALLQEVKKGLSVEEEYGFPYWHIHRGVYQRLLYEAALDVGVTVQVSSPVESVSTSSTSPSVTLRSGKILTADLVIVADGIKSQVRSTMFTKTIEPVDSPSCAYRAIISRSTVLSDPAIAHLLDYNASHAWIGHNRHIIAYPISGGNFNIVLVHPGQAPMGKWNMPGDVQEMRNTFSDFDAVPRRMLEHVESCSKWKLADLDPLETWVGEGGRTVLVGDAAHAMLPYMAQGAAMSVEDGAVLAECVGRARTVDDLGMLLRAYETIRKERAEELQKVSRRNGKVWHLPDGEEQRERDSKMQKNELETHGWGSKKFQVWLFGMDVIAEANKFLDEHPLDP